MILIVLTILTRECASFIVASIHSETGMYASYHINHDQLEIRLELQLVEKRDRTLESWLLYCSKVKNSYDFWNRRYNPGTKLAKDKLLRMLIPIEHELTRIKGDLHYKSGKIHPHTLIGQVAHIQLLHKTKCSRKFPIFKILYKPYARI